MRPEIGHQPGTALELLYQPAAIPRHDAPPILLVHGSWHAAWCWENWMPALAQRGFEVYALSLRGHGGSAGDYRRAETADYLDDVQQAIRQIGRQPLLIGHSFGGWLVQHLLAGERFPAACLLASVPPRYPLWVVLRNFIRNPLTMLGAFLSGDLIGFTRSNTLVREFFSARTPEAKVDACRKRLTGASMRLFIEMMLRKPPAPLPGTPTLVIAGECDGNFTPAMQQRLASRMGATMRVLPGSGHDIPLDVAWQEGIELVAEWLESAS